MQSISSFTRFFNSVFNAFNLLGFLAMPSNRISQNYRYGEQHSDDCDYLHPVAPSKQAKASCVAGFIVNPTADAKAPIRKATVVFDQNFFKISLTFCIAKSPCFFEDFIIPHIKKSCNIQRIWYYITVLLIRKLAVLLLSASFFLSYSFFSPRSHFTKDYENTE